MNRVFIVGALIVVIAVLSLPFILSSQNSEEDDYKKRMAEWHIRWSDSANAMERSALLPELDEIRSPVGSIESLDRHRIYLQAHNIFSRADELATLALENLSPTIATNGVVQPLTCNNVESRIEQLPESGREDVEVTWTLSACSLLAAASNNLVVVRTQALSEWLKDEIRALGG